MRYSLVLSAFVLSCLSLGAVSADAAALPVRPTVSDNSSAPNETILGTNVTRGMQGKDCPGPCTLTFATVPAKRRLEISYLSCAGTFIADVEASLTYSIYKGAALVGSAGIPGIVAKNTAFSSINAGTEVFLPIFAGEHMTITLLSGGGSSLSCAIAGHMLQLP